MYTKSDLVKRWRKLKLPRLYWRSAHRRWYRYWDSDDVAATENMRFKSIGAVREFIEYCERLEEIQPK